MIQKLKKVFADREYRLVITHIIMSFFLKGLSLIISLANTKLYITYFNNNIILGGWYAIVSILNWIRYFDLGIGNGLRNEIVAPLENKDYRKARVLISTGYTVIGVISLIIIVVGCGFSVILDWNKLLNLPRLEVENKVLIIMVITSLIGVGLQFFLKTITSIYLALRKSSVSGMLALATNLIIFLYMKFVNIEDSQDALWIFAIVYAIATIAPLLVLSVWAFITDLRPVRPNIKDYDKSAAQKITSLGMAFFVIQIGLLLVSTTDSWLITYFFKPVDVVSYHVYYRFFSIALTVYALFSQASWSSITKYANEKKTNKIKSTYYFLMVIASIGGVACFAVAFVFDWIVEFWMGDTYNQVSIATACLFALWMWVQMIINASTAVANGLGKLKCQSVFVPISGLLKVIITVVLSKFGFDWNAVLIANAACLIPLLLAQHIAINRELRFIKGKN
jgi:O-antigen/teichoic acid export membrane protein